MLTTSSIIKAIWYDSKSTEMSKMQSTEFIFTFFNSGILILLLNTNLRGSGFSFSYLDGGYSDLNIGWYVYVAPSFITPMFIKYLMPLIGLGL